VLEAIAEFQRSLELENENPEIWSALGHAYASSGKATEAQKVLDHLKGYPRTATSRHLTLRSFTRGWEKRIRQSHGSIERMRNDRIMCRFI
jgi:predicted Zn-dependent protease